MYHAREVSASSRFSKPKLDQTGFTIDHYAGQVRGPVAAEALLC